MAIRAGFFDLDNTLLDTTGTNPLRAQRIAQRLSLDVPDFNIPAFLERVLTRDPATDGVIGVAPLLAELGLTETDLGREALELWFFQGCLDLTRSFPGARDALEVLSAEYTLGVITNGRESRQRSKFESLGFSEYFGVFVSSERAGVEKPAPEIFEFALTEAGVPAGEAVFVGDRLDLDVLGARNAGLLAIWLDHQGRYPAGIGPSPDATFAAFSELPSVLEALAARPDKAPG